MASKTGLAKAKKNFAMFGIGVIALAYAISVVCSVVFVFVPTKNILKSSPSLIASYYQIQMHDKSLTMITELAAASGKNALFEEYLVFSSDLNNAILQLARVSDGIVSQVSIEQLTQANEALVALERKAFKLIAAGYLDDAKTILSGPDYLQYKKIYAASNELIIRQIYEVLDRREKTLATYTDIVFPFMSILFVLLAGPCYVLICRYRN